MDTTQNLLLKKYVDLVCRWKYLLLFLLGVGLLGGLVSYKFIPKTYMATSLLSYQQQQVNADKTSRKVAAEVRDMVSTLTQIVTSRRNLEELIKRFDLYQSERQEYPMEDVVNLMRGDIAIEPSKRGETLEISYRGQDQGKVAKVAKELASKFIEENLRYREAWARETSKYISNELQQAKETMDAKEATMRDYKLKFYNEMPTQRDINLARLTLLQEQHQSMQQNMLELERTRVLIQDQIAARKAVLEAEKRARIYTASSAAANGADSQAQYLDRLRVKLDSLEIRYTDNHPEIKRTKKMIAKLEKEIRNSGPANGPGVGTGDPVDEVLIKLQSQLTNVELSMDSITREKEQLPKRIEQYEKWIAAVPVREAEWSALTREYAQLKNYHDQLVARDLEAKSMLNLERKQKGSQFRIEDPARFPEKPIKPVFLKVMLAALGAIMAFGVGLILLTDFFDGSFRESEELEPFLGVPLITTVSQIQTDDERRKGTIVSMFKITGVSVCFALVIGLYWYMIANGLVVL